MKRAVLDVAELVGNYRRFVSYPQTAEITSLSVPVLNVPVMTTDADLAIDTMGLADDAFLAAAHPSQERATLRVQQLVREDAAFLAARQVGVERDRASAEVHQSPMLRMPPPRDMPAGTLLEDPQGSNMSRG